MWPQRGMDPSGGYPSIEAPGPGLERTFRGHKAAVNAVSFSPDMRELVSGSSDNVLMMWHFRPQLRAFKFIGHKGPVLDVAFAPSGSVIASGSVDRTVRLWLPSVRGESTVLKGHSGAVRSVGFSKNGRHLITASDDKTVKIWSLPSSKFECTLSGHNNWVRSAAFSPDSRLAVSGGDDKVVTIWDVNQHTPIHSFFDHTACVNCVKFHPDGTAVAACSDDATIKIWDARSYQLLQHYPAHGAAATSISFHPSGNYLLSSSVDGTLKIWDLREGRLLYTVEGHRGPINCGAFSYDGRYFASGGADSMVMAWKSGLSQISPLAPTSYLREAPHLSFSPQKTRSVSTRVTPSLPQPPEFDRWEEARQMLPPPPSVRPAPPARSTPVNSPQMQRYPQPSTPHVVTEEVAAMDGRANTPTGGRPGALGPSLVDKEALPEVLAATLDHIVGQLDIVTRTLAILDQRLTLTEDKVEQLYTASQGGGLGSARSPMRNMFSAGDQ